MKYRKKPIVIEAYQTQEPFEIETLEGVMRANAGDWIITGVNGERYPCKPDIFEKTYEPADNQNFLTALCPFCGETLRVDWQNRVIHGVTEPFDDEVSE